MKMLLNRRYFIASLFLHMLLLIVLNFFCVEKRIHKKIVVYGAHSKHSSTALYKPYRTTIPFADPHSNKTGRLGKIGKKGRIAKNITKKTTSKKQSRKANRQKKKQPAAKKAPVAASPKANAVTEKKQPSQKKALSQTPAAKKKAILEPKKKQAKIPPPPQPEKIIKKEELPQEQSAQEPLPIVTPEPVATPEEIPAALEDTVVTTTTQDTDEPQTNEPATEEEITPYDVITEASAEWNALQEYISKEIARVWHPSVGIPRDTEAEVDFTIDNKGNLVASPFKKKSNVIIYDRSIVIAIHEMKFSPLCYNKQFSVKFRQ